MTTLDEYRRIHQYGAWGFQSCSISAANVCRMYGWPKLSTVKVRERLQAIGHGKYFDAVDTYFYPLWDLLDRDGVLNTRMLHEGKGIPKFMPPLLTEKLARFHEQGGP